MKVNTKWLEGHRALQYRYSAGPDCGFHFHLLSEVGEPWQAEAKAKAQALADYYEGEVRQVELAAEPWYVDAIVPRSKP